MQLSDIRTRVRYHLRESTASIWADAELTAQINLAQRHIASRLDVKYLPQLTQFATLAFAGLSKDLPTGFLRPAGNPYGADGVIYPLVSLAEATDYLGQGADANSLLTSRTFSYIINQDLFISVSYTGNVVIPYVKAPTDLSADGDVSSIEDGVIDLVILKAAADAMVKTRQMNEISVLYKMLEDRINAMNGGRK